MHLRTAQGVSWGENSIASGWVNSTLIPCRRSFVAAMSKLGLKLQSSGCQSLLNDNTVYHCLEEDEYAFDPICPKVVNLHEKARERLALSQIVRDHGFVFLVTYNQHYFELFLLITKKKKRSTIKILFVDAARNRII